MTACSAAACSNLSFSGEGPRTIGLVWMTEPDAVGLSSKASPLQDYTLNLKLSDPAGAPAFADAYAGQSSPLVSTWENVATVDGLLVKDAQSVLKPGALLLGLLALASVAVLVGCRLAEHTRRVGLLKAVGGTLGFPKRTETTGAELRARFKGSGAARVYSEIGGVVVYETTDPEVVIVEYDVHGQRTADKGSFVLSYVNIMTIRNGKIVHSKDYTDPITAAKALGMLPRLIEALSEDAAAQ